MTEPYHPGERAIQERTGERDTAVVNGRMIADRIPAGARLFISQQRAAVLAWSAPSGEIWVSFLVGPEGFASATSDLGGLRIRISDPIGVLGRVPPFDGLQAGDKVGMLFIDLATRRRLRANGTLASFDSKRMQVAVEQAYANCPKYIQRRLLVDAPAMPSDTGLEAGRFLSGEVATWIAGADTFFVASAHPDGMMDASHRGGAPGFVTLRDGVLRVPDYPGNSMFNTLGNFLLNPVAGLTFLDFEQSRQLQMTGDARIDLDAGDERALVGGTSRCWEFRPRRWIVSPLNAPVTWRFVDASPFNP